MWQAGASLATLVDECVDVPRMCRHPASPCIRDQLRLVALELGERAHVAPAVDDDFLTLERRIQLGHHAPAPVAVLREHERLWRRHVLVPRAERARLELLRRRRFERRACGSGTLRSSRSDHCDPARLGLAAKLAAQLPPVAFSMKGAMRSIGAGKTIVVDWDAPSSSSVCR